MKDLGRNTCRIALVQAEPAMFDKQACLDKALRFIDKAAAGNAELIVFPELFIPGYPVGMNFGFSVGKRTEPGREDWKRYYDASVVAGGNEETIIFADLDMDMPAACKMEHDVIGHYARPDVLKLEVDDR